MLRLYYCWLLALASVLAFAANLKGSLMDAGITAVFPGDPTYVAVSTPFNLRYTYQPAVVAFPNTPKDVSEILKLSHSLNWTAVARSGGHSYIANGLGGKDGVIVLDMQNLNRITVNPSKNTAVIESGNRLGDIALALSKYGRGLPHGTCPYVGIGGHASYGGFGFTSRMWGLTLDTVISVDMVLANGTMVTANNERNSDIFWAARGAASSFGIVTSIEVKTFPEPPSGIIFQYEWILDVDGMAKALDVVQNYLESGIPPEVGGEINLFRGPTQGTIVFHISGGWYGPADQLNATVALLLENMPEGHSTTITPGNYSESVVFLAGGSLNTHTAPDVHDAFYAKSLMTPEASPMSLETRTAFAHFLANDAFTTDIQWFIQMEIYGGSNSAINAVKPDATSFAHRGSMFTMQFYSAAKGSVPPYPDHGFAFMDSLVSSITANSPANWDYGAYPNYVDDRLVDWQSRYYGAHYLRLQALKDKYDPRGVFSFPTGIENRAR